MEYREILDKACNHLQNLNGVVLNIINISKPIDQDYAKHLAKTISKLSPLVGNMIEYQVCTELNKLDWDNLGEWVRQDPGFPDTIFKSEITPQPGIEIKTWFPNATEITARFKDSIDFFSADQINVAVVAWLPEFIIYGRPKVIDIWTGSAKSLANSRDTHYHSPPNYLVIEPEDTSTRTINLQQSNTNGYRFQGNTEQLAEATKMVDEYGTDYSLYSSSPDYQKVTRKLLSAFPYRLDTNFAKIDRIAHTSLEVFKTKVLNTEILGHSIRHWSRLLSQNDSDIMLLIHELLPEQ